MVRRRIVLPAGFDRLADAKAFAAREDATVETSELLPDGTALVVDEDPADALFRTQVLGFRYGESPPT